MVCDLCDFRRCVFFLVFFGMSRIELHVRVLILAARAMHFLIFTWTTTSTLIILRNPRSALIKRFINQNLNKSPLVTYECYFNRLAGCSGL